MCVYVCVGQLELGQGSLERGGVLLLGCRGPGQGRVLSWAGPSQPVLGHWSLWVPAGAENKRPVVWAISRWSGGSGAQRGACRSWHLREFLVLRAQEDGCLHLLMAVQCLQSPSVPFLQTDRLQEFYRFTNDQIRPLGFEPWLSTEWLGGLGKIPQPLCAPVFSFAK